ncbi:class I SAM-dependent methyltransferase [Desulfonatronovibrio hydrogenovorans]|uniref:class I SAM-dependent methyltransferase n=1 Tax=Desulfonatronovibrio hydrogenovorans TaxID=53245 RepID=UPI00048C0EC0|nr:class I SAM-dependent methyltransferase [Desulfonatronovibrio hydrogenovorans]
MVNNLYNLIISDTTRLCYHNCLRLYPENSSILDVGIGNGIMIKKNHSLIKGKNLSITGLDINKHYLEHCKKMIRVFDLESQVKVHHQSVLTFNPPEKFCFDYIFFGMSFMLMKDQKKVLDRTKEWLKPAGKVIFFQTMFKNKSKLMEFVKPRLKFLTTVDFGQVTYEKDFYELLDQENFCPCEDKLLKKNVFNGEYRLIITRPESAA